MLVVGIVNSVRNRELTPPTEVEIENRFHPQNGGADKFLEFLNEELVPFINKRYRTRQYKILIGHSLGGLFALHALTRHNTFNAYILADPTLVWNNQVAVKEAERFVASTKEANTDLYITATGESGTAMSAIDTLCAALDSYHVNGFRWTFKLMPEETHLSIPHLSIYSGLDHIFDRWHLANRLQLFDEGGLEAIHRHFREGGKRYGYDRQTPPQVVALLVADLIASLRLDEAADVLLHDERNYPAPWNQLDALARAYEQQGKEDQAITFYKLSLGKNPKNEWAKRKLAEFGVDRNKRSVPQR